jgi:hypothetical protein
MIDLVIIVVPLPLVLKVDIRASSNYVDCVIGWKATARLQRLLLLRMQS